MVGAFKFLILRKDKKILVGTPILGMNNLFTFWIDADILRRSV